MGILRKRAAPGSSLVIAGLGNPGPAYHRTRHNLGATVVEELAGRLGVELKRTRDKARIGRGRLEGRDVLLGVPIAYVNESGRPILNMARKAGARPEDVVVCHDELDIPLGRLRLKAGGGTAGHRGLNSICDALRSRDFVRLRIGIGRPDPGDDAVGKVLSAFLPEEREVVEAMIDRAIEGLAIFVRDGMDAAQRYLHAPEPGNVAT